MSRPDRISVQAEVRLVLDDSSGKLTGMAARSAVLHQAVQRRRTGTASCPPRCRRRPGSGCRGRRPRLGERLLALVRLQTAVSCQAAREAIVGSGVPHWQRRMNRPSLPGRMSRCSLEQPGHR